MTSTTKQTLATLMLVFLAGCARCSNAGQSPPLERYCTAESDETRCQLASCWDPVVGVSAGRIEFFNRCEESLFFFDNTTAARGVGGCSDYFARTGPEKVWFSGEVSPSEGGWHEIPPGEALTGPLPDVGDVAQRCDERRSVLADDAPMTLSMILSLPHAEPTAEEPEMIWCEASPCYGFSEPRCGDMPNLYVFENLVEYARDEVPVP